MTIDLTRRPCIVTDADLQWALDAKPDYWDVETRGLTWEDHVADQAEAFEVYNADGRKPAAEWSLMWRNGWWPNADPNIRHPQTAPPKPPIPSVLIKPTHPRWRDVLAACSRGERIVGEAHEVVCWALDDPRAAILGGAS